jgi:hypothetical protein
MKNLMLILGLLFVSSYGFARAHNTMTCKSSDGSISIPVHIGYTKSGDFNGSAEINGVQLKPTESRAFGVLEGSTTGDMDNYQTYQLTIMRTEVTETQTPAVLIEQNHVDRVGYENTIAELSCL